MLSLLHSSKRFYANFLSRCCFYDIPLLDAIIECIVPVLPREFPLYGLAELTRELRFRNVVTGGSSSSPVKSEFYRMSEMFTLCLASRS
jgi:hypothetical protein